MCLESYRLVEEREKPITVYKILTKDWRGYRSPYQYFCWELGKEYTDTGPVCHKNGEISCGVFHTYEYLEDAICSWYIFNKCSNYEKYVIGEFTIPKDAQVYKGMCGGWTNSYGSTKLKFEAIINFDEDIAHALRILRGALSKGSQSSSWVWSLTKEQVDEMVFRYVEELKRDPEYADRDMGSHIERIHEGVDKYYKLRDWIANEKKEKEKEE